MRALRAAPLWLAIRAVPRRWRTRARWQAPPTACARMGDAVTTLRRLALETCKWPPVANRPTAGRALPRRQTARARRPTR